MSIDHGYDVKESLIIIVTFYIDLHGFKEAEQAIQIRILDVIHSFISSDIIIVFNALNAIMNKYVENNQGEAFINIINNTEIIPDLKDTLNESEDEEDIGLINEFLESYDNLSAKFSQV
ncbi:hypothetical protein TVAG_328200 [Trichomonas vaginalis G3]|uniref:Uncharacterized protein n=1 Tax=Trichomonas vaginalis (strain ATCC PRA-98 / G3) TaxID=412133 RepID=A2FWK9_TRIV3|nr:hypothetical protein TVAGG3_0674970 [Trichomonas vaginalis G3]EAX90719.1 hypothetical protein TVAG_328200 [Trichomonas vaginalis G3]KAI5507468.1 hypothetical protein TVAGG3_0674970 [Trichomonas vaginalis G3]|eukprot:XP_001303649.1 hypothetical protein [Trichomonas vaginalis G3]